jgi:hypothetical protein
VRDRQENATAVGRDLTDDDLQFLKSEHGLYGEVYQPRPVLSDATHGRDDITGIHTCGIVSFASQTALKNVYERGVLIGVKAKLETAISLVPTRALPHAHAIATCPLAVDAQFLAEELKTDMDMVLKRFRREMQLPLYASVRVYNIKSPAHLEKTALYTEKPIPLGMLVKDALNRKEARNVDNTWNRAYLDDLEHATINLHEQIQSMTSGFRAFDREFYSLRQRITLGNLRFGKNFIGHEPPWHRDYRDKKTGEAKRKRAEKTMRQARDRRDAEQRRKSVEQRKQAATLTEKILKAGIQTPPASTSSATGLPDLRVAFQTSTNTAPDASGSAVLGRDNRSACPPDPDRPKASHVSSCHACCGRELGHNHKPSYCWH